MKSIPPAIDLRPLIAGALAIVSLLGTIAVIVITLLGGVDADQGQIASTTLGGFTTTFGAYALGLQSEIRK